MFRCMFSGLSASGIVGVHTPTFECVRLSTASSSAPHMDASAQREASRLAKLQAKLQASSTPLAGHKYLRALLLTVLYVAVSCAALVSNEEVCEDGYSYNYDAGGSTGASGCGPWTLIDAIYFSMATMSTVGYGDFSPTPGPMRAFVVLMILVGIGVVFPAVAGCVAGLFMPLTAKGRAFLDWIFPPAYLDIDEDGGQDYAVPASVPIYYTKTLLPSLLLTTSVQLVSAAIFLALEPEWTFGDAMYHCIVTVTTVGYGDQYLATQGGRLFSSFHMLIGVCLLPIRPLPNPCSST